MKILNSYIELINARSKLTKDINSYLDIHSETMDDTLNTHEVWKPYNKMLDEYSKLEDKIRMAEYVQNTK